MPQDPDAQYKVLKKTVSDVSENTHTNAPRKTRRNPAHQPKRGSIWPLELLDLRLSLLDEDEAPHPLVRDGETGSLSSKSIKLGRCESAREDALGTRYMLCSKPCWTLDTQYLNRPESYPLSFGQYAPMVAEWKSQNNDPTAT